MSDFVPNPRQKQAIEHVHGPMLVVAGAGTGKTSVIAARFAWLVSYKHAQLDEILALTYTEEATQHLQEKICEHLGYAGIVADPAQLNVSTFHAHCLGVLQRAGKAFRVLDAQDHWIYLRQRLESLPLKLYLPPRDPGEFLDSLLNFFSRCQDELVDASRYADYVARLAKGKHVLPRVLPSKLDQALSAEQKLARCREIANVFAAIEAKLTADNVGTFGDMISGAVRLLRQRPDLVSLEQRRARFILIDEFQDANVAQIEFAKLLAGTPRNVFAVGDPDQAIYRFRGASSAAFEEFLKRFPGSRGVVLTENQRSTSRILRCAHAVIRENPPVDCRLAEGVDFSRQPLLSAREMRAAKAGKQLRPAPVEIVSNGGKEEEAADLAKTIRELRNAGYDGEIAVIYRQHKHRDELVRELMAERVPFVVEGIDVFDTPVARDLMAAVGAVASLSNSEDLFRVSALPTFGLDPAMVREQLARSGREASYATLLARIPGGNRVMAAIETSRAFAAGANWQAAAVCEFIVRQFGFDEGSPAVAAFQSFVSKWHERPINETGTLEEFVKYLAMFREAHGRLPLPPQPAAGDAVQLMTVHAAKGLEFDRVFVLRIGSSSFPHKYNEDIFEFPQALREMGSLAAVDSKQLHAEEERRLFYVALTRAKDFLSLHARRGRGKDGTPPGYLRELMRADGCKELWTRRDARPFTATLEAAAATSGVASWLLMPPSPRLGSRPLSATSIDAYATCPLKYKLMRDWQIRGPASAAMTYGKIAHDVLGDIHQAILAGRPRTEAEVLQLFQTLITDARFEEEFQRSLFQQQGIRHLSGYVVALAQAPLLPVLYAEKKFEMKVEGVLVTGRMDRVDRLDSGRVRVIDFKTGSTFDQEKADASLQLSIYAIAARETLQSDPADLVIYNLENQSAVRTRRNLQALLETRVKILEVADGIAAGNFDADPGFHCRWCEYRNLCPATEQKLFNIAAAAGASD